LLYGGGEMSVATNGLCPGGRATLEAHDERLDRHESRFEKVEAKLDRINWLLVTTLVVAVMNLAFMVMGR
jgi:elongation factor P hydroxylase